MSLRAPIRHCARSRPHMEALLYNKNPRNQPVFVRRKNMNQYFKQFFFFIKPDSSVFFKICPGDGARWRSEDESDYPLFWGGNSFKFHEIHPIVLETFHRKWKISASCCWWSRSQRFVKGSRLHPLGKDKNFFFTYLKKKKDLGTQKLYKIDVTLQLSESLNISGQLIIQPRWRRQTNTKAPWPWEFSSCGWKRQQLKR